MWTYNFTQRACRTIRCALVHQSIIAKGRREPWAIFIAFFIGAWTRCLTAKAYQNGYARLEFMGMNFPSFANGRFFRNSASSSSARRRHHHAATSSISVFAAAHNLNGLHSISIDHLSSAPTISYALFGPSDDRLLACSLNALLLATTSYDASRIATTTTY